MKSLFLIEQLDVCVRDLKTKQNYYCYAIQIIVP